MPRERLHEPGYRLRHPPKVWLPVIRNGYLHQPTKQSGVMQPIVLLPSEDDMGGALAHCALDEPKAEFRKIDPGKEMLSFPK